MRKNFGQNYFHNHDQNFKLCTHYENNFDRKSVILSPLFNFGQHYSCNLTDRQGFFIMEASTDQKNFNGIIIIMS